MVKLLICWSHISGYMSACWRELARNKGVDLSIIAFKPPGEGSVAPFDENLMKGLNCRYLTEAETADDDLIRSLAEQSGADIIMLNGWLLPGYNKVPDCPALVNKKFVMTMDTPYRGSIRQRLARIKLASFLSKMDRVMVPGERAWQYARRLGFDEAKIRRGMYGVDFDMLSPLYGRRISESPDGWPRRFLYVGRYAEEKAIDVLAEGYRRYCKLVSDPWPLTTCGAGDMSKLLENIPNLTNRGFVQPSDQRDIWASHGAFVMASRSDPWPLVIVEACAAGLPIVCTEACGSAVELVRSQFNGMPVATENPDALARGLLWMHQHHEQCAVMGQRSQQLAAAYSSQMWAQRITRLCEELMSA
jgi:glycosyltransferase involved in cell wall biosynthesis